MAAVSCHIDENDKSAFAKRGECAQCTDSSSDGMEEEGAWVPGALVLAPQTELAP